jgi:phage/plasmid-like protein (TIGR03299 family)
MKNLSREEVIFNVLEATGLNWKVAKKPLFFGNDDYGTEKVDDTFACVRSDNEAVLGVVGKQYTHLQNAEAVATVYDAGAEVFNKDLSIEHPWNNAETLGNFGNIAGGSLKGGKAIFIQLELPSVYIGKSDVNRFISVTNHHDGNKSLGFGTANQVVCCENTFAIAHKELSKIKHTATMQERVDEAVIALRRMLEFEEKQIDIFQRASTMAYDKKHIRQVMDLVFGKDKLDDPKPSGRMKNLVESFAGDLNTSIDEQGETLWTLFNAVTRYTNHTSGAKDKDYSLLFGNDARVNQKAYNWLEDLVTV